MLNEEEYPSDSETSDEDYHPSGCESTNLHETLKIEWPDVPRFFGPSGLLCKIYYLINLDH